MTLKNLQGLLDYYFPERIRDLNAYIVDIPSVIAQYNITMEELAEGIEKVKDFLPEIERDISEDLKKLTQTGSLRVVLTLTNDSCWKVFKKNFERNGWLFNIPKKHFEIRKKWREKLRKEE